MADRDQANHRSMINCVVRCEWRVLQADNCTRSTWFESNSKIVKTHMTDNITYPLKVAILSRQTLHEEKPLELTHSRM